MDPRSSLEPDGLGSQPRRIAGCLGLMFALAESGTGYMGDNYVSFEYPEVLNSAAAGFVTGAVYRAPRGPKAAAITGGLGLAAGAVARSLLDSSTV